MGLMVVSPRLLYPQSMRQARFKALDELEAHPPDAGLSALALNHRLAAAVSVARSAGQILKLHYATQFPHVRYKPGGEPVTTADHEADDLIRTQLSKAFPFDSFLTEETFDVAHTASVANGWVIDPMDGSRNMANNIGHFAVSIAYFEKGCPKLGVVYDPVRDEMFMAKAGGGAFLNGEPIRVSPAREISSRVLISPNYPPSPKLFELRPAIRRIGSSALDLAYVASGRYGAMMENRIRLWDVGAGVLLVREAGGEVTDFEGRPLAMDPKNRFSIVATNGFLHPQILAVVK